MCVEKFQLPKTITWIDTMNIFARMEKMRRLHTMAVAKRFELNLTEVKIMSYLKNNQIERNLNEILECSLIGETSLCRAINHLEQREFIKKALNPQNRRYLQLDFLGRGDLWRAISKWSRKSLSVKFLRGLPERNVCCSDACFGK